MGQEADAAIVAIAAAPFDPLGPADPTLEEVRRDGFDVAVTLSSAMKAGLSIDGRNFYWWLQQPQHVREAIMRDPTDLRQALSQLRRFLAGLSGDNPKRLRIWSMPAAGDLVILENAYAAIGAREPWLSKNRRCLSTLKAMLPLDWPSARQPREDKHIAIVDVHRQILDARAACQALARLAASSAVPGTPVRETRTE